MKRIGMILLVCFSSSVAMKREVFGLERDDTVLITPDYFDEAPLKKVKMDQDKKQMAEYEAQWKSWRKCAKKFEVMPMCLQDDYIRFISKQLMRGTPVSACLKQVHNAINREGEHIQKLKAQLACAYKIHLMPYDEDIVPIMTQLLTSLGQDEELQKAVSFFKICQYTDRIHRRSDASYGPIMVVYPHASKQAAQYVLNKLYALFQNLRGRDISPRYNQKITSLLYCAQGDSNYKDDAFAPYYEPDRVYYRSDFEGDHKEYRLENPAIKF